ncbi:MAG: DNA-protecting protein DprA, partial [Bacteroidales bacterium]|nr:DNA-protecting protein DprA [Bacteroidales bacterium]
MTEQFYNLAFSFLKGIGIVDKVKIIKTEKDFADFFKSGEDDLISKWHLSPNAAKTVIGNRDSALKKAEKEIALITAAAGTGIISYHDKNYPPLLREIPDAPIALFVRGNPEALTENSIAVVGTRNATHYGLIQTRHIVSGLLYSKLAIISGLAMGIDTEAHKTALENNLKTVA